MICYFILLLTIIVHFCFYKSKLEATRLNLIVRKLYDLIFLYYIIKSKTVLYLNIISTYFVKLSAFMRTTSSQFDRYK